MNLPPLIIATIFSGGTPSKFHVSIRKENFGINSDPIDYETFDTIEEVKKWLDVRGFEKLVVNIFDNLGDFMSVNEYSVLF